MEQKWYDLLDEIWHDIVSSQRLTPVENIVTWDTDGIQVLHAAVAMTPESIMYGTLICEFEYKDVFYRCHFAIHRPGQGNDHGHERMTDIGCLRCRTECLQDGAFDWIELCDCDAKVFAMAFWDNTPEDCLGQDALALRHLMENIKNIAKKTTCVRSALQVMAYMRNGIEQLMKQSGTNYIISLTLSGVYYLLY